MNLTNEMLNYCSSDQQVIQSRFLGPYLHITFYLRHSKIQKKVVKYISDRSEQITDGLSTVKKL